MYARPGSHSAAMTFLDPAHMLKMRREAMNVSRRAGGSSNKASMRPSSSLPQLAKASPNSPSLARARPISPYSINLAAENERVEEEARVRKQLLRRAAAAVETSSSREAMDAVALGIPTWEQFRRLHLEKAAVVVEQKRRRAAREVSYAGERFAAMRSNPRARWYQPEPEEVAEREVVWQVCRRLF